VKKLEKHFCSSVIILSDSEPAKALLVYHRKFDGWQEPGGHMLPDENPVETAIREVKEETGLDVSPYFDSGTSLDERATIVPRPAYIAEEHIDPYGKDPEHYHTDLIYSIRVPEQPVKSESRKKHDIGWFTKEQIVSLPMLQNVRVLINQEFGKSDG
jgi:8-oxo-dGTP pyrophosphatase MutT (NUDIX family)